MKVSQFASMSGMVVSALVFGLAAGPGQAEEFKLKPIIVSGGQAHPSQQVRDR